MTGPTSFSESIGLVQPRSIIQKDSVDEPLRNKLWDITRLGFLAGPDDHNRRRTCLQIWVHFFDRASDTLPATSVAVLKVREWFFACEWNRIYDLLTFLLHTCTPQVAREEVIRGLNEDLERYLSAYRWVGDAFVPIVEDVQIEAMEDALTSPLAGVRAHLDKALRLLSDREHPDEENSVKESISAVESVCSAILGRSTTLGGALKRLEEAGVRIHPSLEGGWRKIYGYTSDEGGIRHGMQDDPNLSVEDALYFLISCSAFVSLLTSKARDAGLELAPQD